MNNSWHSETIKSVAKKLSVEISKGLTVERSQRRIEKYGYNELKEAQGETLFHRIIKQFKDFLIIILIAASLVSMFVGEITDSLVIIAIVIVNAVLGIVQEGKAEKALEALKKMSAPNAKILRNGKIEILPARMLVPGDIVLIEAGDIVPADIRIIESVNLKIDEASLTGESVPVQKDADALVGDDAGIGDRENMAYMSTIVTYGRGSGIVVNTGGNTEIGKIAGKIQEIHDEKTPLQQNLDVLGKWLGVACLGICIVVFVIGILRGGKLLDMFMTSVSLAVAAIPEGLPAVVTIVLALGMKRMVERNAVVRKLLAVETLGSVDVICSDKTGTLTQNEMTVVRLYSGGKNIKVEGKGYNPKGEFISESDEKIDPKDDPDFRLLLLAGMLCNDASINLRDDGKWSIIGDPTEAALVVAAEKAGYMKDEANKLYPRVHEIPFDSGRKMMTTFHSDFQISSSGQNGKRAGANIISFTKGAPDIVVKRCRRYYTDGRACILDDKTREEIGKVNSGFAKMALRVLACACRQYDIVPENAVSEAVENDMVFIGLIGMIDPARAEVKDAIKVCKRAGIKPVMITGDYKETAAAIAEELDLMEKNDGVLSGQDIDSMSDEQLLKVVENTSVYARVSPEHKVRILEAFKKNGHIASMTGDGVNDAMALKKADIGVAMGITGTDVAKGAADIVLTDDNFASIVAAVEEGRIIYSNIRKFVFFLLSCNVGEVLIVFVSMLLGYPIPLVPIQILWLNLITDSFPALALGTEKGEPDIMDMKPRKPGEPILNKPMIIGITVQSAALLAAVLGAYIAALNRYPDYITNSSHLMYARTYAFATLITAELIRSYSSRSERATIFKMGILTNRMLVWASLVSFGLLLLVIYIPFMRPIFNTIYLSFTDWITILIFCTIPFLSGELYKLIIRRASKA
jgi:Ca2+-transporting ATPase